MLAADSRQLRLDAAAVLGENQRQEEEPGALSACGCALANAGRDLVVAASALSEEGDWACAADALGEVATSLETAGASVGADSGGDWLSEAASELEDAASVTGCISLAAAAGPNLQAAADALSGTASALAERGADLDSGPSAAHQTAGMRLGEAANAIGAAAAGLRAAGEQLEQGTAGPS